MGAGAAAVGPILSGVGALAGAAGSFMGGDEEADVGFVQPPAGPGVGLGTDLLNQAGPYTGVNPAQFELTPLTSDFYNQLGPAQQEALLRSGEAISSASGLAPLSGVDVSALEGFIQSGAAQRARNIVRAGQERAAAGGPAAAIRQGTAGALGGLDRATAEALTRTRLAGQAQQFSQTAQRAGLIDQLARSQLNMALTPAQFEVMRGQANNAVTQGNFANQLAAQQLDNQVRGIGAGLVTGGTPAPITTVSGGGPGAVSQALSGFGGALAGTGQAWNQWQFNQALADQLKTPEKKPDNRYLSFNPVEPGYGASAQPYLNQ